MVKAVIFDYSWTLYNPDTNSLYPGAVQLLKALHKKGYKLAVISKAGDVSERLDEMSGIGLSKYFEVVEAVPEGAPKEFGGILAKLGLSGEECLVVGDRIRSEILEGNKIGAKTVWFKNGYFAEELPENENEKPDFTINSLPEVWEILNKYSI